jgi:drug/metabolite transporter (DMT)-like permease
LTAVVLALAASLTWGLADFGAGVSARRSSPLLVAAGVQAGGLVLVASVVAAGGEHAPTGRELAWAAFAGAAGIGGLAAFYSALAVGTMGIVGPITATAAIVPLAFGLARGEHPDQLQAVGIGLALVGVVAASVEHLPEGRRIGTGVGLGMLAALLFGCSLVGLSRAASGGVGWATLVMRLTALPLVVTLAAVTGAPRRPTRRGFATLAAIGVGDAGATLLFAAASTRGLLSVVSVLASLYPIVLVVLGRIVLAERLARAQLGGVAVALAGVALISAG